MNDIQNNNIASESSKSNVQQGNDTPQGGFGMNERQEHNKQQEFSDVADVNETNNWEDEDEDDGIGEWTSATEKNDGVWKGVEVEIVKTEKIYENPRNPYQVEMNGEMEELIESIRVNGILTPIIVRDFVNMSDMNELISGYEIISGHRRMFASRQLGLVSVPVIIHYDMPDEDADIALVDSNKHRAKVLVSEKANAYKLKYDAIKRRAGRPAPNATLESQNLTENPNKNCPQLGDNSLKGRSIDIIGAESGESGNTVERYIRLTYLIPGLLKLMDVPDKHKSLSLGVGVNLSYLSRSEQEYLEYVIQNTRVPRISLSMSKRMKEISERAGLTNEEMEDILREGSPPMPKKITFAFTEQEMERFFPSQTATAEMREEILKLLEKRRREGRQEDLQLTNANNSVTTNSSDLSKTS